MKQIVIVASLALICGSVVLGYLAIVGLRSVTGGAAVNSGQPNGGVASRNREAARASFNAIGEIQSVTSVGANFMQYTAAIQSAKIKFDAAMRDYEPHDPSDQQIRSELGEAFYCYVDAQDAWSEFIKNGEGHFIYDGDIVIKPLAEKYGFKADSVSFSDRPQFYQDTVLQAIWGKANLKLRSVSERMH